MFGAAGGVALEHLTGLRRLGLRKRRRTFRPGENMLNLLQDARFGVRTLIKTPSITFLAVLTLAFGIAVNSTLFSLVNTILFSDLPVGDPDRFVFVWASNDVAGEPRSALSLPDYAQIVEESSTLDGVAFFMRDALVLSGQDEPIKVVAGRTSDNLVEVWGLDIVVGRGFRPGEDRPGADPVVLLSHGFWERHYGLDPAVLGKSQLLDGRAHTVVGVLSPALEYGDISQIDLWIPLALNPATQKWGERKGLVTARLARGAAVAEASAELATIAASVARAHPDTHKDWNLRASPFTEELLNDDDSALLSVLALSVAFVLLIACANVATMIMTKANARSKEVAVRLALGAPRLRLVRQFLTEGFLISAVAAIVGLAFTRLLLSGLVLITSETHWLYRSADIDQNVLLFTVGISMLTPFVFSLLPSFRASTPRLITTLKDGGRDGLARSRLRSQRFLVASQVGMALVLMVVTGLLVRTVIEIRALELGFEPTSLLAVSVDLPEADYPSPLSQHRMYERIVEELVSAPGVVEAGVVERHPLEDPGNRQAFSVQGREGGTEFEIPTAYVLSASPAYFDAMQIPLAAGRGFRASDDAAASPVALVSEVLADKYWPNASPLGQRVRVNGVDESWVQIVGVVGSVFDITNDNNAPEFAPQLYLPFAQRPGARGAVIVRAQTSATVLTAPVREKIQTLDANLAVGMRTMEGLKEELMASSNAIIALFLIFAAFALVMASMGIYGVVSFWVSQRRREIGIRMALGAKRKDVIRMVSSQGARLIVVGCLAGFAAAFVIARLLSSVVVGITTTDPWTFAVTGVGLSAVALVANYIPAWHATKIDPVETLRAD